MSGNRTRWIDLSAILLAVLLDPTGSAHAQTAVYVDNRVNSTSTPSLTFAANGVFSSFIETDYRTVFPTTDIGEHITSLTCNPIVTGRARAYGNAGSLIHLPAPPGPPIPIAIPGFVRSRTQIDMGFSSTCTTGVRNKHMHSNTQVNQRIVLVRPAYPPGTILPEDLRVTLQGMFNGYLAFNTPAPGIAHYAQIQVSIGDASINIEVETPLPGTGADREIMTLYASGFCDNVAVEDALRVGLLSSSGYISAPFCLEAGIAWGDPAQVQQFWVDILKVTEINARITGGSGSGSAFDPTRTFHALTELVFDPVVRIDPTVVDPLLANVELVHPDTNYPEVLDIDTALAEIDPAQRDHFITALEDFYEVDLPEPVALAQQFFAMAVLLGLRWRLRRKS